MKLKASLAVAAVVLCAVIAQAGPQVGRAADGPSMLDPNLTVRPFASGLTTPSSISFIGPSDLLVLEKNTGKVMRVANGVVQGAVLDLSVNFASERGLLGIALHPSFPTNPGVYLFWSCRSTAAFDADPFRPEEQECSDDPGAMFGQPDTDELLRVPLRGNRVDRFVWTGSGLVFDRNLVKLRSIQNDGAPDPPGQGDSAQPARGNHN